MGRRDDWRPEQGRARVASQFVVEGARVATYVRHDDGLRWALVAAGLDEDDEVTERQGSAPSSDPDPG